MEENRNDEGLIEIHKQRLKTVHNRLCSIYSSLRSPKPLPSETVWQAFWIICNWSLSQGTRDLEGLRSSRKSPLCVPYYSQIRRTKSCTEYIRGIQEKEREKLYKYYKESVVYRTASTLKIVRAPILIQELCRPPNSNISKLLENTTTVMMNPVVQYHAFSLFWLTACLPQILPSPSVFLRIGIIHAS